MTAPRRFVVTVDGRRHEVQVLPHYGDAPVEVLVDGVRRRVHTCADGDVLVRAAADGPHVRVTLPTGPAPSSAATPARNHTVVVRSARRAALDDAKEAERAGGSVGATIEAPMPGRVVAVLVKDGDIVQADAPVVIVEAMKMENEVRTPVAGRVTGLKAEAGATVEPGQTLCAIEPVATPSAAEPSQTHT